MLKILCTHTTTDSTCNSGDSSSHSTGQLGGQIRYFLHMGLGHNESMTMAYGLNIKDSNNLIGFVDFIAG
jgi:hypothetical protein